MNKCKCFCHWVMGILSVLGLAAAVLFIWSDLSNAQVLGKGVEDYFMWAVVLLLLSRGNRMLCRCCNHGGCMCDASESMGGAKTCSHPMGCKCGDCSRCQ